MKIACSLATTGALGLNPRRQVVPEAVAREDGVVEIYKWSVAGATIFEAKPTCTPQNGIEHRQHLALAIPILLDMQKVGFLPEIARIIAS